MNTKLTKLAAGLALSLSAMAALPTTAQATAIAQSIIKIEDLTFAQADGAAGRSTTALNPSIFSAIDGTQSGDVSASLGGAVPSTDIFNLAVDINGTVNQAISKCQGSGCGSYVPGSDLNPLPATQTFSYSGASLSGNILDIDSNGGAGVDVFLDNTVSIQGTSTGSAQSNTGLSVTYGFNVTSSGLSIEIAFNASSIFNQLIEKTGEAAETAYKWSLLLEKSGEGTVLSWTPNAAPTGTLAGTVFSSPFNLNPPSTNVNNPLFNKHLVNPSQSFEIETGLLTAGTYQLTIGALSKADAKAIPEPTSLALLGLGLLGLGGVKARRRSA